jgi:hypothetical protein
MVLYTITILSAAYGFARGIKIKLNFSQMSECKKTFDCCGISIEFSEQPQTF